MLIPAYNLVVKLNGTRIAKCQECQLSVNVELREKAGNTLWREYLAGLSDYAISAQGLICETSTSLLRTQIARQLVTVSFEVGDESLTGQCWLTRTSLGGGVMGKGTWNVELTGNGVLT